MSKTISMNELFSGIGAQRKSLLNLDYDVDVVGIAEIDKYAIQSYEAMYGKTRNYGDISAIEKLDYADLWTYSFPCQDISYAGKQRGINENTRSGLLYQVQRLLEVAKEEDTLPKYLLLENVKALVGKKFKAQFDEWLQYLDDLGYKNYWQVLNAKDYGIPQNRERVFVVSIRKDINQDYVFPEKEKLKTNIRDILEDEVDEKYYLNEQQVQKITNSTFTQERTRIQTGDMCQTLLSRGYKDPKIVVDKCIGESRGRNPENPSDRTVGSPTKQRLEINSQGISNTLTTVQKDNYVVENLIIDDTQDFNGVRLYNNISPTLRAGRHGLKVFDDRDYPKITEYSNSIQRIDVSQTVSVRKYNVDIDSLKHLLKECKNKCGLSVKAIATQINLPLTKVEHWFRADDCFAIPDAKYWYKLKHILGIETDIFDLAITTFEVREGVYEKANRCYLDVGISPTLTTIGTEKVITDKRIRKLTPLEYWRLMGFTDEDFNKAKASGVSNSQLYKQAGNSIVVNVLERIFGNLFY